MTTLREILDEYGELVKTDDCFDEACLRAVESWAYGQERECDASGCEWGKVVIGQEDHAGHRDDVYGDCPTCHGTGTIREPGLVERVIERVNAKPAYPVAAALREELGVPE